MLTIVSALKRSDGFVVTLVVWLLVTLTGDLATAAVDRTGPATPDGEVPVAKALHERSGGVERITLDLAAPVGHVAHRKGDRLILWLDQPRRFDLDALSDRSGSRLLGARTPEEGATRWLVLDLAPGSDVRSEGLEDDRLIITIQRHGDKSAAAGEDRQKAAGATEKAPDQVTIAVKHAEAKNGTDQDGETLASAEAERGANAPKAPRRLIPETTSATDDVATAAAAAPAPPPEPDTAERDEPSIQPASQPGQFEVDASALDRALERTLTREGALLLPFGSIEIEPSLRYVRQEFGAPTLINLFGFPAFGETKIRRNDYAAALAAKFGLPFDAQLEVDVPFTYVDQSVMTTIGFDPVNEDDSDTGAFGDLGVALAKTVLKEAAWWPDVVARVRWDSQTGKSADNGIALGGGAHELTGSVSLVKSQDPLAFFGTAAYEKTFEENDLDPGDRVSLSVGTVLAASPETSLRASLRHDFTGDAEFDGDQLDGTDQMAATLSIGASSVLARGVLLDASAEVGLTEDAPDYAARISLPIRFDLRRAFSLGRRQASDGG